MRSLLMVLTVAAFAVAALALFRELAVNPMTRQARRIAEFGKRFGQENIDRIKNYR